MFQLLFVLSFPFFLAMALGGRVLPGAKSGFDNNTLRSSNGLLADAAAAARSTIAIALTD